jgi:hypothetical protein
VAKKSLDRKNSVRKCACRAKESPVGSVFNLSQELNGYCSYFRLVRALGVSQLSWPAFGRLLPSAGRRERSAMLACVFGA